jgi:hypothetical protein
MKKTMFFLLMLGCINVSFAQNWTIVGDTTANLFESNDFDFKINSKEEICLGIVNIKGGVRAYARLWDGQTWSAYGGAGMSASTSEQLQVSVTSEDRFMLAYRDIGLNNGTVVRAYNKAEDTWDFFGNQFSGVTGGYTDNIQVVLDTFGNPWMALQQNQFSSNFALLAYDPDTENYNILDDEGPTGQSLDEYNIAFSPNNELYIAYQDTTFENDPNRSLRNRLTVKKWTNGQWELVGEPSISEGNARDMKLAFDSNNTPFVAYVDNANSAEHRGFASAVRYFDGSSWLPVGPKFFVKQYATYLDFQISPDDTLVVSYSSLPLNAMNAYAFNGTEWQKIGENDASTGRALWGKIAFSPNGVLYTAHQDMTRDGKITVSSYTGNLTSPSATSSSLRLNLKRTLQLYPNPVKSNLTMYNLPEEGSVLSIYDAYGRKVETIQAFGATFNYSLSHLASGTYFVKVDDLENYAVARFIKN